MTIEERLAFIRRAAVYEPPCLPPEPKARSRWRVVVELLLARVFAQ